MNKTQWKKLISKAPYAQKLISKNIKYPTKEKQLEAVKRNGYSIQYIHNPDKEVQLEAVKKNGYSIRFIHNPDKEVQLEAVKKNGYNIRYIHNPDKEVQLEAVKQDSCSIQYIRDPCKEAIIHYLIATCPELLQDPRYDLKEPNEKKRQRKTKHTVTNEKISAQTTRAKNSNQKPSTR
jgi:hypothetical protein